MSCRGRCIDRLVGPLSQEVQNIKEERGLKGTLAQRWAPRVWSRRPERLPSGQRRVGILELGRSMTISCILYHRILLQNQPLGAAHRPSHCVRRSDRLERARVCVSGTWKIKSLSQCVRFWEPLLDRGQRSLWVIMVYNHGTSETGRERTGRVNKM